MFLIHKNLLKAPHCKSGQSDSPLAAISTRMQHMIQNESLGNNSYNGLKESLHLISWFVCALRQAAEHQIMQSQYGTQDARFKTNESWPHMFHDCSSFYLPCGTVR